LLYTEEFGQHDRLNCEFVKEATGGGRFTAARKYENAVEFPFIGKLVFATNVLPELPNLDKALARRVRAIPFDENIPAKLGYRRKQSEVITELLAEAPGILDDLAQAAAEWYSMGREAMDAFPTRVKEATDKYLLEQDKVKQWMAVCCEAKGGRHEERPFAQWYRSFLTATDSDARWVSKKWFGKQLEQHNFAKFQRASGRTYEGPALTAVAARVVSESGYDYDLSDVESREPGTAV
jgi:phage/plasmid-associated DNA primase